MRAMAWVSFTGQPSSSVQKFDFVVGAVDKEAGAHARFEVVASEIVPVEVKQALRGAMPGEAIGKAVNQTVVEGEHEGGVDGVRRRNRGSLGRAASFSLFFGHGETV